jgi:hypothetical protein
MADDSTDSLFGFILFILFLAFLGYAAGGVSSSSSTAGTTGGTSPSLPLLAGSAVPSCTGTLTLKQDKSSDTATPPALNLKVYVDPNDPGRKCATATKAPGELVRVKVTLAYTADKTQMVSDEATTDTDLTASVQVNDTDDFCVSAVAELIGTGIKVTIPKVVEQCTTVPVTRPVPGLPARSDDKEDEEGY